MDNLTELKSIWLSAKTDDLPAAEEMLQLVKKFRDGKLRSKRKVIMLSSAVVVFWIVFMWFMKPAMVLTWVGAVMTAMSAVVLIWTNARSMKRFTDLNECSNREFLAFLEQTRRNQLYYYTRTQVLGMTLNTVGIFLYLYEFLHFSIIAMLIGYGVMTAVMLVSWLYIRPRSYREQSAKLSATIEKLEKISNQIEEHE